MKFDYITACVNTLDYLRITFLEHNRTEFDRFTIVTDSKDIATQKFCEKEGLNCVVTDSFYLGGRSFDRGLALNYGLASIRHDAEWICHLDSDVFVPKNWREKMGQLKPDFFYGARRVLIETYEDYLDFTNGKKTEADFETPLGIGYGFFQMFHWSSPQIQTVDVKNYQLWYPASPRGDCTESDWMMRNKWGEHAPGDYTKTLGKLEELPFHVYHLGEHGKNHRGRVTPQFTA